MIKKISLILVIALFLSSFAYALEERFEDVMATVVVGSVFKLSVDRDDLDFGLIKPGKRVELYAGRHYNEVTAISNNGKGWYLKMSIPGGIRGVKGDIIPEDRLKWQITSVDGEGNILQGWQSLGEHPVLVYTSAGQDNRGDEVRIRLKYALDVPADVTAGSYQTTIFYTITETP